MVYRLDEIHIATFATHPDYRRQGIGKKLLYHTLRAAKEEGAITNSFWKCAPVMKPR